MNIADQKQRPRGNVDRSALDIAHGSRRGPSTKHRRAHSGWDGLTPPEFKVARLMEEGLSNRKIADRLLLSRRMVATHVSHILKKLGGHSRTDIARLKGVSDRFEALASATEQ